MTSANRELHISDLFTPEQFRRIAAKTLGPHGLNMTSAAYRRAWPDRKDWFESTIGVINKQNQEIRDYFIKEFAGALAAEVAPERRDPITNLLASPDSPNREYISALVRSTDQRQPIPDIQTRAEVFGQIESRLAVRGNLTIDVTDHERAVLEQIQPEIQELDYATRTYENEDNSGIVRKFLELRPIGARAQTQLNNWIDEDSGKADVALKQYNRALIYHSLPQEVRVGIVSDLISEKKHRLSITFSRERVGPSYNVLEPLSIPQDQEADAKIEEQPQSVLTSPKLPERKAPSKEVLIDTNTPTSELQIVIDSNQLLRAVVYSIQESRESETLAELEKLATQQADILGDKRVQYIQALMHNIRSLQIGDSIWSIGRGLPDLLEP